MEGLTIYLDIFFTGISTFISIFLIYVGVRKRWMYNLAIGFSLLFFAFDFFITIAEEFIVNYSIPFNFYILVLLALYIYSHFIIRSKKELFFVINILIQIFNFFIILIFINSLETTLQLIIIFSSVINVYILLITIINIKRYNHTIKSLYSSMIQFDLSGILLISYLFLIFNLIWIIDDTLSLSVDFKLYFVSYTFSYIAVVFLGFHALLSQYRIIDIQQTINDVAQLNEEQNTNTLPKVDKELFDRIENYLTENKAYLNPDLSLNELSKQLGAKNKIISQSINHYSKTTFYNYINKYRIEHFKTLIKSNKNAEISIDGLIEICGFKSKSTFYSHFKRIEYCTPTEFIANI